MSLFAAVAAHADPDTRYSLKDPALNEIWGYGARTLAGPIVTETTAFTAAAFYDGVNQISSDIAKQPLNLLAKRPSGGSDVLTGHPTHQLMKFSPNPETRSMVFRRTLTAHALVYGNGYAEIVRDSVGRPRELWCLHPRRVEPFYENFRTQPLGASRAALRYRVDGQTLLAPSDVLHIQGLSDDTVSGLNMVSVAREALGLALASQQFAASFFGNGTRFGGILSSDTMDIDEEQEQELRARIEKFHARADKAFRLLVMGAGFSFQETGTAPNDAQMTEVRDQQVTEVARFLNMPLHKLKLATPGAQSYASNEISEIGYYKGTLLNWVRTWEEELNAKLISPRQLGTQEFKHNFRSFLRGDLKSQNEALAIALDRGVINANEWRDWIDLNPQAGDQGDMYLVQGAMVPKDQLAEIVSAKTDADKASAEASRRPTPTEDEVTEATDRAATAEALAAEARHDAQTARETLAAAEATGTAKDEEIARYVADVERLSAISETQAAVATFAQEHADAIRAERDEHEQARKDAEAQVVQTRAELDETRTKLDEAETAAQAAEATAQAEKAAREAEAAAAEERAMATATQAETRETREKAVIASHRALVADAIGRMVRRECDDARRKQGTQARLKKWLVGYPELHTPRCIDALLPAVRVHVAWSGADDDPAQVAESLARAHVEAFTAQVQTAIESDAGDYHAVLDRVLTRWERDRANVVADAVLAQEIDHVSH